MNATDFTDGFCEELYDFMDDELCILCLTRHDFHYNMEYVDTVGARSYEIYNTSLIKEFKKFFQNKTYDVKTAIILCQDLIAKQTEDWDWVASPTLASIKKKPWINEILSMVKEKHEEFHKMNKSVKKVTKESTPDDAECYPVEEPKKSGRLVSAVKKTAKTVVVRKVSRNASKALGKLAMSHFENNPLVAGLLASPLGAAAAPAILAILLEFAPLPEAIKNQIAPYKDSLVEELQTLALDEGTAPLEDLAAKILPALMEAIGPLLMAAPSVKQLSEGKSNTFNAPEHVAFDVKIKS